MMPLGRAPYPARPRVEVFIGIVTAALGSRRPGGGSGTTNLPIVHLALREARAVAVKAAPGPPRERRPT